MKTLFEIIVNRIQEIIQDGRRVFVNYLAALRSWRGKEENGITE
jgi:hypothetical protein